MQLKLSQEAAALKDLVMPVLSCINSSVEKLADFSQSEVQQAQAAQKFDGVTSMLGQLQSGIQNVHKRVLDVESMQSDTKAFAIGTRDAFEASLQSIDQSITYVLEDCRAEKAPVLQELDLLSAQQAKLSQRLGVLLEIISHKCSQDANPSCELQTVFEELAKLSVSMNTVLEQQEKLLESPKPDVAMDDSADEAKVSPELGLLFLHEQALTTINSNLGKIFDLLSDRRADVQELRIKQKPSGQQIKPDQGSEETTATTVHDLDASLRDMLQKMADAVEAQKPAMEDMKSLKFKVEQLGLLCSSISASVDMIREPGAGPDSTSSSQDVDHEANPSCELQTVFEELAKLSVSMNTVLEQQEKLFESPKPDVAMDDSADEAKVSPELGLLFLHEQALTTINSNLGKIFDLLSDRRADVQELRIKQKPSGQQIKPDQGSEETTATTVHDLDASLRDMLQKMADTVEAQKPAMEDMKSLKFKVEQLGLLCSSISTSVDMIREPGAGPDSTSSSQDVGHQANPCLDKLDALLEEHSKQSMSMSTVQESLLSSQQQAWSELQDISHSLCDRLDQHKPEAVEIRRVKHRVEQLGQLFCQQLALSKTTNDLLQGNASKGAGFWEDEALSSWKKLFPSTNQQSCEASCGCRSSACWVIRHS